MECLILIPLSEHIYRNSELIYAPPLSDWKYLIISLRGILNRCFQFNEFLQHFIFFLDEENPSVSRKIIYKGHNIPRSIHICGGNISLDIGMNQPQDTWCMDCLSSIKLVLRVFADNTTFANSTRSFDGWEAFNHGMFMKLLQVLEVQVSKSLMPKPTNLIPMSQKSNGLFIWLKLWKLIGLRMMVS